MTTDTYPCPCEAPAALTCEQCVTAKPEAAFTAALVAPLDTPIICDECLDTLPVDLVVTMLHQNERAARIAMTGPLLAAPAAECACCYSVQPCHDDGEAYICTDRAACQARQAAAPATLAALPSPSDTPGPDALVGAAPIAAPTLVRAPQCDYFGREAWKHVGHTFYVAAGHVPIGCSICEAARVDCEAPRDPSADLRTMEALLRATLEVWKNLDRPTSYDDELAALARQVERLNAAPPVCRECGGPHIAATCPAVKVERERQAKLAHDGAGVWKNYRTDRNRFLCALGRSASSDCVAMAESLAYYLSTSTNTSLSTDRVLNCWSKELAALA